MPRNDSTFKRHVQLAYKLYALPKDFRPFTYWHLFKACQAGKYEEIETELSLRTAAWKATLTEAEQFDKLVDDLG